MKRYIKSDEDFIIYTPKDLDEAYMNYKAIKISKYVPKETQAKLRKLKASYKKQMQELRDKYHEYVDDCISEAPSTVDSAYIDECFNRGVESGLFDEADYKAFKRMWKNADKNIVNAASDTTGYTPMTYENKIDVMKWLDTAESRIRKYLKTLTTDTTFYEVDDVSWGTDCFRIPIFKGDFRKPGRTIEIDAFKFCYDPDDVFERDAEQQLDEKLYEFIDEFSFRHTFNS